MPGASCGYGINMVLSHSQDVPHHVRSFSDGQYLCDINCPQWMSSQICSPTLAVAEQNSELLKFLEWYMKLGQGPNLSSLDLSGFPKARGQKDRRPKRQKARSTTPAPNTRGLTVMHHGHNEQGHLDHPLRSV